MKHPADTFSSDPWISAMLAGDYARAWAICDQVLAERVRNDIDCWHWPRHEQFLWRGESLAHKQILVHCYHGLGDTLQFARFLTPLSSIAARVDVWTQPALLDIVSRIPGVHAAYALHDGAPDLERDIDMEIMELGHALRIDTGHLQNTLPYIDVGLAPHRERNESPCVGLVWQTGGWDAQRSLSTAHIAALMRSLPSVTWYSFQYPRSDETLPQALNDASCSDIREMGRRLQSMDLLISVDTMAAHLAGALGLPVWTLLPKECDWRWLSSRIDSPWYPTMRLFRQQRSGDWKSVIATVAQELQVEGSRRCAVATGES